MEWIIQKWIIFETNGPKLTGGGQSEDELLFPNLPKGFMCDSKLQHWSSA